MSTSQQDNKSTRSIKKRIIIKKSFSPQAKKKARQLVERGLEGKQVVKTASPNVLKEIKLLLNQEGLTKEFIIRAYRGILEQEYEKPKASDVLKILERLEKLHGIQEKEDHKIPRGLEDAITRGQVTTFIIGITKKTQDYLKRLEGQEVKSQQDHAATSSHEDTTKRQQGHKTTSGQEVHEGVVVDENGEAA